ncbi:MAG: AAA family ATPase [Planctomycetaceae bacterium]|nr:AAA family ATPase [Planctomycetaceae bacterium]
MTDASGSAFVETKEYRRFREFCDACRRYRYIGLCYGPPGVGKTLSARHYADWDRVASADPYAGRAAFRSDEVPGHGCVVYTAAVVNSPRQIEDEVARLRRKLCDLMLQAVRGEAQPVIAAARRALEQERDRTFVCHDWLTGKPERLRRAEAAAAAAVDDLTVRSRGVGDPTELLLVDEVDRLKMSGLEQLRALFDAGGLGLVLIGMPGLERRLARYAQLYSRIGFVHEFRPLPAAEVRTLLAGWRPPGVMLPEDLLADAEGVAAIIRITGGNFRLLDRLLTQVGRILALNGLQSVTREVVEAAREVLVIGAA